MAALTEREKEKERKEGERIYNLKKKKKPARFLLQRSP
jgi:hypothetical protein